MRRHQTLYTRTPKRTRTKTGSSSIGPVLVVLAILGLGLSVALTKVYLEHNTKKMGYEWEARNSDLNELLKEEVNLTMQREELTSGNYILPKAEQMGLRHTQAGQIRRIWGPEDPSSMAGAM